MADHVEQQCVPPAVQEEAVAGPDAAVQQQDAPPPPPPPEPASVKQEQPQQPQQQQQEQAQPAGDGNGDVKEEVSDELVKERLLALLADSDLGSTTEKMLRKKLEEELGVELKAKKNLIRAEVLAYLEAHQPPAGDDEEEEAEEEDEDNEEEAGAGSKRGRGSALGNLLSEPLAAFLGVPRMARPQVVKKLWEYIKANDLQDPANRRNIIVDERLGTLFTPPITMFNMNKQLSKHVFRAGDVLGGDDDDDGEGAAPRRKAAPPKKKAKTSSGAARAPQGFAKPLPISAELAAAVGEPEMSRGGLMKWLYAYVDEHNLKDPSDKRYANADATLQQLTGESRFMLFGAQKYFKKHFPPAK